MKIAIPTAQEKLCQHFGHCEKFVFIEINEETKEILGKEALEPPTHAPGVLPAWVAEHGAKVVLAGGMGGHAQALFANQGIKVLVGCSSDVPEKIAQDYLSGALIQGSNACDH